ncbi:MAG: signal recognition particle-docking protein FtsY [Alphaproteobacteria bacterium]|nr:signal recognition particle-docking protein FtsY [Alphaproteobacteria bacterium]MDY4690389.1 signal recognition particle-docking protein FtsY [Alphaproteobacteria bacterium]
MSNFWQKLGLGLKKSSDKISGGLTDIFSKKKLDSASLTELEDLLLISDMGVKATNALLADFAAQKQDKDITDVEIRRLLAEKIEDILKPCEQEFSVESAKPYVILMVGVNGAGKTTTIGKLAAKLQAQGKKVSFIAGDTFRAAAVEQLKIWADRLNISVFRGADGCDSAGLCYDGLQQAIKNGDDVVFIDTAGRLQNKNGLMDELKKIVRVMQKVIPEAPHKVLLTIDATTGQNAISQIQIFKDISGVNGLVVTKLDGSAKGGIIVAAAEEFALPVYFIGVGEQIEDLDSFNAHDYANALLGL